MGWTKLRFFSVPAGGGLLLGPVWIEWGRGEVWLHKVWRTERSWKLYP